VKISSWKQRPSSTHVAGATIVVAALVTAVACLSHGGIDAAADRVAMTAVPLMRISDKIQTAHDARCVELRSLREVIAKQKPSSMSDWKSQVSRCRQPNGAINALLAEASTISDKSDSAGSAESPVAARLAVLSAYQNRLDGELDIVTRLGREGRTTEALSIADDLIHHANQFSRSIRGVASHAEAHTFDSVAAIHQYSTVALLMSVVLAVAVIAVTGTRLASARAPAAPVKPAAEKQTAPRSVDSNQLVDLQGAKILVADDGPLNQQMMSRVLGKAGGLVTIAEDGQLALERFGDAQQANEPFDLVVTDINMPELDGVELTRRLRSSGFTGPVIATTACSKENEAETYADAGFDEFISKPIDRTRLLVVVAGQLERHGLLSLA